MNSLITHLESILSPGWPTLILIGLMCGIAAYTIKEYLPQPIMVIFIFPLMLFCGLFTYYLFVTFEQFPLKKIDQWVMWTILAAISGTVVGIGLVCILAVVREWLGKRRAPPAKPARATR